MRVDRSLVVVMLFSTFHLAAQERPAPPPGKSPGSRAATDLSAVEFVRKNVEANLRKIYAWGPAFRVNIAPLKDAPVPGFYEVTAEVTMGAQSDSAVMYVSKDGRYLLRGDIQDMSTDPLAAVRSQIHLAGNPSKGPENARVVVVEYADFQCPTCRQLHQTLRAIGPGYPQVRFVFKDFPLVQIHPWAMTAAIAGRCAFQQNPEAFWKLHDSIFDSQDVISPQNAWQNMLDFAAKADLDTSAFRACMTSPEATQAVQENVKEGQVLKIANTPTLFVNGRRMIGNDRALLEQYLQYELTPQVTVPATKPTP
jgi:protein-disulfide isomerase